MSDFKDQVENLACELLGVAGGGATTVVHLPALVGHAAIAAAVLRLVDAVAREKKDPEDGHGSREELIFQVGVCQREIADLKRDNELLRQLATP